MKKILCYGDSNTYGYIPSTGLRYDKNTRWSGILQKNLGADYEIIEEGMCDRTGFVDNPKGFIFSASKHFPDLISKCLSIDVLILAIGTNDLQFQYDIQSETIKNGLQKLIDKAKEKTEKVIIIPPVLLNENILDGYFNFQFDKTSIYKSQQVSKIYKQLANSNNCSYFDINKIARPSDTDGLHYDKVSHQIIADNLTDFILNFI